MQGRSGVYQITNLINGKFYIGSSKNIDFRWASHRAGFKKPESCTRSILYNAVKKYGVENFKFEILEECEPIKEVLLALEQHYIDTLKPVYNLMPTAGSRLGSKSSPETIAKLRLLRHTDEWKQQASIRALAYMSDPEIKAKYSELREGKTWDELFGVDRSRQIRTQLSASRKLSPMVCAGWNKGLQMPETQRLLLSEIRTRLIADGLEPWNKGKPMSDELRAKLEAGGFWEVSDGKRQHQSEAHLGKPAPWNSHPMPEEQKQRASETAKANFDPDHQARMTEAARLANTGKARPQEVCDKISESNLKSEARKAYVESIRGIARPEVGQKVSEALQTSEKAKAYHEGRIGKSRGKNGSGRGGVIWDKSRNKWQVRICSKMYGRFERLEDAIAKVEEVLAYRNAS